MARCRHYAYTCRMAIPTGKRRGAFWPTVRGVIGVALSVVAGAVVTTLSWPAWYDVAPVIPLTQRVLRIGLAVAPGLVVAGIGLELLAGLPLVRWFATWTDNLAIKGRPNSPMAAWRDLRARDEASRRWQERQRGPRATMKTDQVDRLDVRLYADVERDHRGHGDEDPPLYQAGRSAAVPANPSGGNRASPKDSLSPEARQAFWRVFARPPSDPSPPGSPRPDGIVLDTEASEALIRDVLKDDQQKPG